MLQFVVCLELRGPSIHPIFRTTGLLDVLIAYATVTEVRPTNLRHAARTTASMGLSGLLCMQAGQYNPWPVDVDPHNFATTSAVDLEFKRLVRHRMCRLLARLARLSSNQP
eukprot:30062-Eustigmatos_ZCMA.PRE.1